MMDNEEQAAVRSIAPADDHRDGVATFSEDARAQLTHHYAGLAMQVNLTQLTKKYIDFQPGHADMCVDAASLLVDALERHHTLRMNKAQGNG